MIWRALACDYDSTRASNDRIGPKALDAREAARRAGVRPILVTGRTFFELIRVCERLDLFDAAVAENGGVLYFPAKGMLRDQGPAPPSRLLAELDERNIVYQLGRVIVEVCRGDEARVGEAVAVVGARMELAYNRTALMLLPPASSTQRVATCRAGSSRSSSIGRSGPSSRRSSGGGAGRGSMACGACSDGWSPTPSRTRHSRKSSGEECRRCVVASTPPTRSGAVFLDAGLTGRAHDLGAREVTDPHHLAPVVVLRGDRLIEANPSDDVYEYGFPVEARDQRG